MIFKVVTGSINYFPIAVCLTHLSVLGREGPARAEFSLWLLFGQIAIDWTLAKAELHPFVAQSTRWVDRC